MLHMPGTAEVRGPEAQTQQVVLYRTAFPDLRFTIEDQIAEGDKVVNRVTARGTHRGEFRGIPPTGQEMRVTGITIDRIVVGKLHESWASWDFLGLLQQLGLVPGPGQGGG